LIRNEYEITQLITTPLPPLLLKARKLPPQMKEGLGVVDGFAKREVIS